MVSFKGQKVTIIRYESYHMVHNLSDMHQVAIHDPEAIWIIIELHCLKNHKKRLKSNVENTRESQEGSLPNFIKSADNTFLIKGNGLKIFEKFDWWRILEMIQYGKGT